jgi:hypothetical protein
MQGSGKGRVQKKQARVYRLQNDIELLVLRRRRRCGGIAIASASF